MSEEIKEAPAPVEAPKAKQFLILADEMHMALLGRLIPGLLYVQVEGMAMQGNSDYMLLVNPVKKEVKTVPIEGVKPEEPRVD